MKRALLIIFIIALATGTFYYLKYYYVRDKVDIWDLVPGNTLAVYEAEQPIKVWNDFLGLPVWKNLSSIPEINSLNENLIHLDSITGSEGNLERLFSDREILISFHKVSNTEFGTIFYINLNTAEKSKILNTIITYFDQVEQFNHDTRNFEDIVIHELISRDGRHDFTFIEYKNYFVGSFTPLLIDDVIRNISDSFQVNFKTLSYDIFRAQPIELDAGNLYISVARIPELIGNFVIRDNSKDHSDYLKWFSGATYYDISFEGNRIFLNGSSRIPVSQNEYFLSTFYDQSPQDVEAIYYLPNRTATYISYTYDDFISWRRSVDVFWERNFPGLLKRKMEFLREYDMYEEDFYRWIGNEVGLATLQSIDLDHPDKLFIIKSNDYSESSAMLNELIMIVNEKNSDTTLYEDYSGKRIQQIAIPELPATLMGDEFLGFENSYFTDLGSYIVIGNSFEVVKHLLNEIDEENTWGKSLKFMQYFENVQKRANVNYFINFSNAWNSFFGSLNDEWATFFKDFDYQFKHFEILSFQFSNINNNFYTSAAIQHRPETSIITTPSEFFKEQLVVTDYPIVTKPYIFRSHLDRSLEVMVVDEANNVYFIGSDGKLLWKRKIGESIKSDIFQVDYYKNGKYQYLFASDSSLYMIDRNGNSLREFPVKMKHPLDLAQMNLIDYDNSRNYRYMLCDSKGIVYLTDKNGNELEAWDPKDIGGPCLEAPFHIRIGGRDCMLAIRKDGLVNMMNRRSETYSGFPLNVNSELSSAVFIQRGADFNRTLMHLVNDAGEVIKLNLNADVVDRQQLYRPDRESKFQIVPDALSNTYVVSRQDYNRVSVLAQSGETIFERELLFTGDLEVQFYNFSAGNEIYIFTDPQQDFTYLFDGNGELINMQPVESGFKVGLIYSEVSNKYNLYSCYGNQFSVISFYRK